MKINERLLKLRKEAGFSQEEVANRLNVSRQTISKWETGESNPDFDKIIPLCELYNITSDELLKGIKDKEDNKSINNELTNDLEIKEEIKIYNRKTAKIITLSIFLYFLSIIWILVGSTIEKMSEELMVSIFLLICAIATCILIYYFVSHHKDEAVKKEIKMKNKRYEKIDRLLALLATIIYLTISFLTMRWDITWIIWIVYALISEISHIIIDSKEGENDEI